MLKSTLLVAAMIVAVGSTDVYAGSAGGYARKGHDHARHIGYKYNYGYGPYAGRYRHYRGSHYRGSHYRGSHGAWQKHRYGSGRFDYRGRPYCQLRPRKVPIRVWDRRGNPYKKWVWKDVKVCV